MLGLRLKIFVFIISLLFTGVIIHYVRKEVMDLKYTLVWILSGLIILILAFVPESITIFSHFVGIALPVNALFLMGLLFSLVIIFTMTVTISKISLRVTRLAQEVAIIKLELDKYKNQKNSHPPGE